MRIRRPRGGVRAWTATVWIAVAGLAGCGKSETPQNRGSRRPDVVLITIDTLRADRVGALGSDARITPAIDALARDGAAFFDATAHAPLTLPSHASILTGRYPTTHGVHDNSGFTLGEAVPTLASVFRAAGYYTAAFVSSYVLRGATGLAHGFERYDDRFAAAGRAHLTTTSLERRAADVARDARQWIATAPRPFFLWVHFYDPHAPYEPAPAFAVKFPGRPYEGEVAAADFGVGMLIDALSVGGAQQLVAVTGDHGESLGEHGESEHGMLLYDSTLHVPLVMRGPGVPIGVSIRRQVRHVDLFPTLLDLAGVAAPHGIDGVSLVPLLHGRTEVRHESGLYRPPIWHVPVVTAAEQAGEAPASYAETRFGELHFGWHPLRSLRDGEWKYIDGGRPELYRLTVDRTEEADVTGARADTAAGMARALAGFAGGAAPAAGADSAASERLRSLGYVTGRVDLGERGGNPRLQIADYERYVAAFNRAGADLESGRAASAEAAFRRLAREFPRAFEPHQYLARALAARRGTAEAAAELDIAIQLNPRESILYFDAARTLADAGQFDRAFARVEEGRRLEPASFYGALTEGLVARAAGQIDRAERAFRDAIQMNPTLAVAHFELGQIADGRGDRDAARREYERAIEGDATFDPARRALERLTR